MRRSNSDDDERLTPLLLVIWIVTLPPALLVAHLFYDVGGRGPIPPPDEARVECSSGVPYNVTEQQAYHLGNYANNKWTSPQSRYSLGKTIQVQVIWILCQIECHGRQGKFPLLSIEDALGISSADEVRAALAHVREKAWHSETRWIYPWCTHALWCLYDAPYKPDAFTVTLKWMAWSSIIIAAWPLFAFALYLSAYMQQHDRALKIYHILTALHTRLMAILGGDTSAV